MLRLPSPTILATLFSASVLALAPAQEALVPTSLFTVPDDLEITVWATTPQLYNPTNMDFDKDGRLWVTEGVNYRGHAGRRKEGDRVVVLEDTDGDGKADKSEPFTQEKGWIAPLGIAVLDNKVIVSMPPEMIVFTDVNGDRKFDPAVDKREVLLTGFGGRNHDHSLHSVTAGPDGLWYFNQGNTGAKFTDKSGKTFRMGSAYMEQQNAGLKSDDGNVWIGGFTARMNPDGTNVQIMGHNFRNSYEQTVTSLGDIFQSDNDDPPACRVAAMLEGGNAGFASRDGKRPWENDRRPGQSVPTAEWRQDDPGTMPSGDVYGGGSPTGVTFYENGALDKKWSGLLLTCEAGRNVIFGYIPKPEGAGFKLERTEFITSNKAKKYAGSDFQGGRPNNEIETLFRPSDVTVGPDGAIYVADWYDPRVGGHSDLDKTMSGTIYRIAPKGFKSVVPKIDLATTEGQLTALKSPAPNVRNSGFTRLRAQGEKAVPAVAALLKDENPFIAARAVWLLAQMGPAGLAQVRPLLASPTEATRLLAFRALRRVNDDVLGLAKRLAVDPSAAVRREVALSLRAFPLADSRGPLLEIAKRFDGQDRAYLEAFGLACTGKEREMYQAVSAALGGPAEQWSEPMAWLAWRLGSPDAVADLKLRALSSKLAEPQRKRMLDALAFIPVRAAALAMVDLATAKESTLKEPALWWLNNRRNNEWKEFDLVPIMKERGLIQEKPLVASPSPEPPAGKSKLPPATEILALQGDAKRGEQAFAACYLCHKAGNQGQELGPDLTAFGKTQPREVIINAILTPSAEISHGYEATRVITTDNLTIDGIAKDQGDPLIIKSVGGLSQSIPKSRIKSVAPLGRSLMFSPDLLNLTPQTIADLTAYLKALGAK
jgi:putative membrane-bound dehydrogenase-like protein